MSSELISISLLCKKNIPGLVNFKYIPFEWMLSNTLNYQGLPYLNNQNYFSIESINLLPGKDWLEGFFQKGSIVVDYESKESKDNTFFPVTFEANLVNDDILIDQEFNKMVSYRFILLIKDKNNKYRLLGSIKRPLTFSYKKTKSQGKDNYQFGFTGLTTRSPIIGVYTE